MRATFLGGLRKDKDRAAREAKRRRTGPERAEQLAATFPALLVEASRVAATVSQGVHSRRRAGRGEAFWQFRRYSPGDPAQSIDWRQSAKSGPLYVREREWEAAESVWLWRDTSPSMRYRSTTRYVEKQERADLLLLAVAALLLRAGERVALLGTGVAPAGGRAVLERLAETMYRMEADVESRDETEGKAPDYSGDDVPPVARLPRFSRLILIGDFLSPLPRIAAAVRTHAAQGVACHMLQVLDPAEETLPFEGRVRFEGLEGEPSLLVERAESLRQAYTARMETRRQQLRELAVHANGSFAIHHTDQPPQTALLALYEALGQRTTGYRAETTA